MKYRSTSTRVTRKIGRGYKRRFDNEESEPSEGSCDSGVGLDHQAEVQLAVSTRNSLSYNFEEETNSEFCFPDMPGRGRGAVAESTLALSAPLAGSSRDGRAVLAIVSQPEQQHRARYQTEGSRGAIKDRTGNGFPMVKLTGYNKPTTLQIFVGTDVGRVAPHMFYQACRVSGKNSTPCIERKVDGTVVIEVDLDPSKDMVVTCDCVGILKERNVDVEHRFPDQTAARNKKKSTRCRMVFRTVVQNDDGTTDLLQVCSQPIVCTQPPGVPEICKKSLTSCQAIGGDELFVFGKNFLKDTKVVFQNSDIHPPWEEIVFPDKEFLQQNHLVCVIPRYKIPDIKDPVPVKMYITSSGKSSDPHTFVYLPCHSNMSSSPMDTQPCSSYFSGATSSAFINGNRVLAKGCNMAGVHNAHGDEDSNCLEPGNKEVPLMWASATKHEPCHDEETMMPPPPDLIPLGRRPSFHVVSEREECKVEVVDEMNEQSMSCDRDSSLSPTEMQGVDLSMKPPPLLCQLVDMPNLNNNALQMSKQFPILYENQPFMDDSMLRPPPSKILARDFVDGVPFQAKNDVAMAEPPQSGFALVTRVRSGSFSHSSNFSDNSASRFDSYSRVRSASMSHSFGSKASHFSQVAPTLHSNSSRIKEYDFGISSMTKQAVQRIQSGLFSMPPVTQKELLTRDATMTSPPLMPNAITSTGVLDAIVNSAADSHISTEVAPPAFSVTPFQAVQHTSTSLFDATAPAETAPVPVTVSEMSQRIGDMVVPPGPAPPITGMVTQEMVKMTDNDLISYINPNAFDQVKLETYDAL